MAVVHEVISDWKKGLKLIAYMMLIGVLGPLGMLVFLSFFITIPYIIFGFSLDFLNENIEDIVYIAIVVLGPYFVGRYWNEIQN